MTQITYRKTILGWYNAELPGGVYNVNPQVFRNLTGVSEAAFFGCTEITEEQAKVIKRKGILIELRGSVTWVSA